MHVVLISLGWLPRGNYLGHMMNQCFKVAVSNVTIPPAKHEGSSFSISLPTRVIIGYKSLIGYMIFKYFFLVHGTSLLL